MKQHLLNFFLGVTVGVGLSSVTSFVAYAACRPQQQANGQARSGDALAPSVAEAAYTPLAHVLQPLAPQLKCRRH